MSAQNLGGRSSENTQHGCSRVHAPSMITMASIHIDRCGQSFPLSSELAYSGMQHVKVYKPGGKVCGEHLARFQIDSFAVFHRTGSMSGDFRQWRCVSPDVAEPHYDPQLRNLLSNEKSHCSSKDSTGGQSSISAPKIRGTP